ncbi:MAG: polyprenyl synthetase family protein [Clostridiaceae bacterium]|nr:polyprenyl synthetase family protein [Clostridiaceae bacterium]
MNFEQELNYLSVLVEQYLTEYFDQYDDPFEKNILESMRYSLFAGGKRIRPVLSLAVAKLLSGRLDDIMPFAAAIEMIHTYSLIHDDLPSMDNDDYRRGKLTNHKVFGEAMAVLSGDCLLNEAYELMMKTALNAGNKMEHALNAAYHIARAAGKSGMISGQVIDIESEGKAVSPETLKQMYGRKTGALLKASVIAPALYLDVSASIMDALSEYADGIGLAFQIKDDILDVESSTEKMGKPAGSDERNKKTTYVTLFGLENAKNKLSDVVNKAIDAVVPFGEKAWFLKEMAFYIEKRAY